MRASRSDNPARWAKPASARYTRESSFIVVSEANSKHECDVLIKQNNTLL